MCLNRPERGSSASCTSGNGTDAGCDSTDTSHGLNAHSDMITSNDGTMHRGDDSDEEVASGADELDHIVIRLVNLQQKHGVR